MVKNLEKKCEPAQKQSTGNRNNKGLRDAKLKAVGISCFKEGNNPYCKVCKDSGSLMMCGHCSRSYHLHCANMLESDIPAGTWFCQYCVQYVEKRLKDDYLKLEKSERHHKESKIKHFSGKVNDEQKDITVRWFEKKYPEYVKQGKIQYPIADELILKECELSQSPLPMALPMPHPLNFPTEDIGDLFFVVDFFYNFGKMMKVSSFSVEQLYYALNANVETTLIKELHMALIKLLIGHVLSRENTYEVLNDDSKFLFSAAQLSELFDITELLPYSWLTLLNEIIHLPIFKDYADDSILLNRDESYLELNYFGYSFKEKLGILILLINCLFDVKELHDELSRRLEEKGEMAKEKAKLNLEIKEIELKLPEIKGLAATRKASSMTEKIQKKQIKIEEINKKLETIHLRTSPIGLDRDYNEYYFFKWDLKKLYVRMNSSIAQLPSEKNEDSGVWYAFTRFSSLDMLLQALCPKGIRENKLIEGIKWAKDRLKLIPGDDSSTSSEMQIDEPNPQFKGIDNYVNKESAFKDEESTVDVFRNMLLQIEKKFTKYLKKENKLWEGYERSEEWKREVMKADEPSVLANLLLEHSQKSASPLKLASSSDQSGDSDEERVYTQKYRKVSIKIWQDLGDYCQLWENLTQSITTFGQLALVIGIYQEVLDQYIAKKNETNKHENESKKKVKEEEKRVLRSEVKKIPIEISSSSSSSSEDDLKHEDNCFFCDDGGKLICCETCPKVVHPKCIGLKKVPKEDWYCDECKYKQQNAPQTRLRTRLRKNE